MLDTKKIKVAAFDIDGTILPYEQQKFGKNIIQMFQDLHDKGVKSVISTAREFVSIRELLDDLPMLDYFIGANGMFVYDVQNKKVIFEKPISLHDAKKIHEFVMKQPNNHGYMIMDHDYAWVTENYNTDTWFLRPIKNKIRLLNDFKDVNPNELLVITVPSEDEVETDKQLVDIAKFIEEEKLDVAINSKWSRGYFVAPKNINKFATLTWLCEYLGYKSDENLIAFGDSSNDYEMIKNAAWGVALGNASEKIKSVANDVADDVINDGAYFKLKELQII